jgi:AraC-like DNA-binding protein
MEIESFVDGGAVPVICTVFDETEGMGNRQCTVDGEPSVWQSTNGILYYPTIDGVAVFDTHAMASPREAPSTEIDEVLVDTRHVIRPNGRIRLEEPQVVEFHFTALDFLAPHKLRFRYMLEGYDRSWRSVRPGENRVAYYVNLDSGDYTFRVQAANNDGVWSETGASLALSIQSPLLVRVVFLVVALVAAGIAGGTTFLVRRRSARSKKPRKYQTSAMAPEMAEKVIPKLRHLMEEDKVFLDPELTLQGLARKLGIHYNYLSRIINERFGQSFNDYINKHRIDEAKTRLADPKEKRKTISDIMYDTGFYSKSVFNTTFKKLTGKTPSEYRQSKAEG